MPMMIKPPTESQHDRNRAGRQENQNKGI